MIDRFSDWAPKFFFLTLDRLEVVIRGIVIEFN